MPVRNLLIALVMLVSAAISTFAQTVAINGAMPPTPVSTGVAAGMTVSVTGGPGNTTDWIALYPVGAPDNAPVSWSYLSGTTTPPSSGLTAASFTVYAPLTADDYEFRLFANDGWTRIATSAVITVAASGAVLTVNGVTAPTVATAQAGSPINVSLVNGPGNATDWLALAPAGSADGTVLDWRYLNGATVPPGSGSTSGSAQFLAPAAAGNYEIRLFAHDSYSRVATSALAVSASSAAMMVNDTAPPTAVSVVAGTYVTVDITGGPAQPGDWAGLYAVNAADNAPMSWKYLNGSTTMPSSGLTDATLTFAVPMSAGSYEFRFFAADTLTRLATSTTMVVSASAASLSVNGVAGPGATTAAAGSQAIVSVNGGPANRGDSVALYLVGQPDSAVLDWRYLNDTAQLPATGVSTATLHMGAPTTPGTYEFRFFTDTGGLLSTSGPMVVPQTSAQITVNGVAPPTPVSAAPGSTVAVVITGGPANATDWVALAAQGAPNGTHIAWQYLNGLTVPPETGLAGGSLSFVLPSGAGLFELRLFANNTLQRITTSAVVIASTDPPVVTISLTNPFPGTVFNGPPSLLLNASAFISGGTISQVDFYTGSTLIGSATASPYVTTWPSPAQGVHILTAVAVDSGSGSTTSAPVSIAIAPSGIDEGTLGVPVASPQGGAFTTPPTVTLVADPTATIRFTLDGSEPTELSNSYTAPIAIPTSGATLQARAFKHGWSESAVASATYVIDSTAPTITATVSPPANSLGWNNSTVTVMFACADDLALATCPQPVIVSNEGAAQLISRAAVDSAGNQTVVNVSINLDRTAPSVELPDDLSTVAEDAELVFEIPFTESLSGASSATCNGVMPQSVGSSFTCSLALRNGQNIIVVSVADAAGNVGSDSVMVRWLPTAEATSIALSPASAGMIVGESRTFSVKDDQERILTATWQSSDTDVLDFVDGIATAIAPGEVTVTATADGLSATANVTVYQGPFLPAGALRWSSPSLAGSPELADTVILNSLQVGVPSLLSIEFTSSDRVQPLVRGLSIDGTEVMTGGLPLSPNEWVGNVPMADPFGGIVTQVVDLSTNAHSIIRASWSDGVASWRRSLPSGHGVYQLLQAPDGTIYTLEGSYEPGQFNSEAPTTYRYTLDIVGMDGNTGAVRFRKRVPSFMSYQRRFDRYFEDVYILPAIDGFVVSSDGYLNLTLTTGFSHEIPIFSWSRDTKFMRIDSNGTTVIEDVWQGTGESALTFQYRVGNMQADGAGGVFFQMTDWNHASGVITGRYRSATYSAEYAMAQGLLGLIVEPYWGNVTSIESKSISMRQFGDMKLLSSFDMRTGAVDWEIETAETATIAISGGGAVLTDGTGGYRTIDSSGITESQTTFGIGVGPHAFGRVHGRDGGGTLKAIPLQILDDATAANANRYGVFGKSHDLVLGRRHVALQLVPRDQKTWRESLLWGPLLIREQKVLGEWWFLTIGGGPGNPEIPCLGFINAGINRNSDVHEPPADRERLPIPLHQEDEAMNRLLSRTFAFPNNTLDYECLPTPVTDGYNSNSFLRGLLNAAGLPLPLFPFVTFLELPVFPGWDKPIPASYFSLQ